jgi:glycosyltransferase involved in cell wall biosynthesis
VLTSEKTSMEEAAGDAALYFNPKDHQDIADKMMLIYKDENLRKQLIEKGKLNVVKFSWEKSAELFWQSILKTIGK